MEDLTLEEFMKNPEKYREPEPADAGPPYRIDYVQKSDGYQSTVSAFWMPGGEAPQEQPTAAEALALMHALVRSKKWRENRYHEKLILILRDSRGDEIARIPEDLPF